MDIVDIMDICLSSLVFFPRCPWLEDIGMLDVSTSMLGNQASNFLSTNEIPQRLGNQHPNIVPYQAGGFGEPSECTDDDFMIFFHFSSVCS